MDFHVRFQRPFVEQLVANVKKDLDKAFPHELDYPFSVGPQL